MTALETLLNHLSELEKKRTFIEGGENEKAYLNAIANTHAKLLEIISVQNEALRTVSKAWHEDCGCLVECKIAHEALDQAEKIAEGKE